MELNKKTIKEFKKKISSISNDFKKEVGNVLIKLIGEVNLFPFTIYYHKTIEMEGEKFIPDYCLNIKNLDEEYMVIIELKEYSDIQSVLPQLDKFYNQISKFKNDSTYKDIKIYPLFVIESEDDITVELSNRAHKYGIKLYKSDLFEELDSMMGDLTPQHALLDFLKNKFNIMIKYEPEDIEVYAVQNNTFNVNLLTFSISARELLKLAYVYRSNPYDSESEMRYQRLINGDRLNDIKKFITTKNFESVFPNNIICNFSPDSRCSIEDTSLTKIKKICFENKYSALWIIDGQHRLFALTKLQKEEERLLDEYHYTITAYKNIKQRDQAKIFFCINNEQTGINSNLVCYILSQLKEDKEGAAASVALMLESRGVFKSKIFKGMKREGGRKKCWLNLKTFVDYLCPSNDKKHPAENLVGWSNDGRGWLQQHETDLETPVEILSLYFESVKERFSSDWNKNAEGFTQSPAGIAVFLKILLKILNKETKYSNPESVLQLKRRDFNRYLNRYNMKLNHRIPDLEIDEWKYARTKTHISKIFEFMWNEMC